MNSLIFTKSYSINSVEKNIYIEREREGGRRKGREREGDREKGREIERKKKT